MKINVTVDVSEFYSDDNDSSMKEQIKDHICSMIKQQIWNKFKEEATTSFENQVKRQLDLDKDLKIKQTIDELFDKKEVKKRYSNSEVVSFKDYIEDYFVHATVNSNDFMNKVNNTIKSQADSIAKQLKDRYDLLFASQIVSKLNEIGMLKDDIAKLLLDDKK